MVPDTKLKEKKILSVLNCKHKFFFFSGVGTSEAKQRWDSLMSDD